MDLRATQDAYETRALQLWLMVLRHEAKYTRIQLAHLQRRNQHSSAPVTRPGGPVVSVTTHGERLASVHLALESIAAGSLLPSRLLLWVDDPEAFANPSPGLQRLIARGLELRLSENFGPHTKYYPFLLSMQSFDQPLVTGDDDLLYSRWWLRGLAEAHRQHPEAINCYRAHVVGVAAGRVLPYRTWAPCSTTAASLRHFATGVSGTIYPPPLLEALKRAGSAFMNVCPKADDVWLHANALRLNMPTRQIRDRGLRFPFVPGTQESGLYHTNVLQSRNDEQIERTYSSSDIEQMQAVDVTQYA